jgi:hypothetical protein
MLVKNQRSLGVVERTAFTSVVVTTLSLSLSV